MQNPYAKYKEQSVMTMTQGDVYKRQIGETFRQSTVNMKSPVIINHKTNLAMQVILDQDYPIRMPVFGPESEESVC